MSEYASWLFGSGSICVRLEKNVDRIASAFGARADMTIMPRHIHLYISLLSDEETVSVVTVPKNIPVSFDINTRLSRLSWEVSDRHLDLRETKQLFEKAVNPPLLNTRLLIILVSLANAAFCRLFGGDLCSVAIAGIAAMAGFWLRNLLTARNVDVRIAMFICAMISSILGSTGLLFSIGDTPNIALGTSILYLVPGIPFLNSLSDLIYKHYICAIGRFTDAVILTCCLSAGLCAAMILMNVGMF